MDARSGSLAGGCARLSAAARLTAPPPALKAADWAVPFFCLSVVCFASHRGFPKVFGTFQSRDSRVARGRPAEGALGRPRPAPKKLLGPAPGCPRVSHLGISEAAFHVTSMWKSR